MGKLKEHMMGWLDEYGNELGYDMSNCPSLEDFWWEMQGFNDLETLKEKVKDLEKE